MKGKIVAKKLRRIASHIKTRAGHENGFTYHIRRGLPNTSEGTRRPTKNQGKFCSDFNRSEPHNAKMHPCV